MTYAWVWPCFEALSYITQIDFSVSDAGLEHNMHLHWNCSENILPGKKKNQQEQFFFARFLSKISDTWVWFLKVKNRFGFGMSDWTEIKQMPWGKWTLPVNHCSHEMWLHTETCLAITFIDQGPWSIYCRVSFRDGLQVQTVWAAHDSKEQQSPRHELR